MSKVFPIQSCLHPDTNEEGWERFEHHVACQEQLHALMEKALNNGWLLYKVEKAGEIYLSVYIRYAALFRKPDSMLSIPIIIPKDRDSKVGQKLQRRVSA